MTTTGKEGAKTTGVTWLGHATVVLDTPGFRLVTDPVLGGRVGMLRRVAPPITPAAVENVGAVLVSHAHGDHLDLPSLRRVGKAVPVVAPPAVTEHLRRRGFSSLHEVTPGSIVTLGGTTVEVTAATHDGRRWPLGAPAEAVGFLVHGDPAVYFAGDTDLFPAMSDLAGRVDLALLPVWGWGPTLGPGHLDPERAATAAATIQPRVAIPIHWGTIARPGRRPSRETLNRPPQAFAAAMARVAPEVEVRVLAPGERTEMVRTTAEGRNG
jgi:L-ascorbate metabolism protein UlaG (beta-lactamase superfamily)